jgi:hypothetical protein
MDSEFGSYAYVRVKIVVALRRAGVLRDCMFSHIVTFYTHPDQPDAADKLVAGCHQYLRSIPGIVHFHVGKMMPSERAVVSQEYQVGLNIVFDSIESERAYQPHPSHAEFVEKVFRPCCHKAVIYDFS